MRKKLHIHSKSLKDFLSLFKDEDVMENLSLGDTWHPSSGYVDESILNGQTTVGELLIFPYDFKGLVAFKCTIDGYEIEYIELEDRKNNEIWPEVYEIKEVEYKLNDLIHKMIEENVYHPGKYEYKLMPEYEESNPKMDSV